MDDPLIAIVGRPNVGKSTLFNRLVGRRDAIVTGTAGTTRDRLIGDVTWWNGSKFTIVDTGGLELKPQDQMRAHIKAQVELAVDQADVIIFLLDVTDGITPLDWEIASWLRITQKQIVTTINKVDNLKREYESPEFFSLGIGEPFQISAYHNLGIHDLIEYITSLLPTVETYDPTKDSGVIKLSIAGRTNVGKSMLINAILGKDRSIVSDQPGTTRDALDTPFRYGSQQMVLVDTAGIRRRGKVAQGIEYYSVLRAVRAIQRSDISLLVMDATELATAQDAHVSEHAWDGYKGLIAVINKWDLVESSGNYAKEMAIQAVRDRLHFMPYVPIVFTSALLKQGIDDLMSLVLAIYQERCKEISQEDLRYTIMAAIADQMPPIKNGKRLRIYNVSQISSNPPAFLFTVNDPSLVHFSYQRYLENRLRSSFAFIHTHLRLIFKVRRK